MTYIQKNDTIAAISTAVSPSGIGIIRISGPDAVSVADRIYRSPGGTKKLCSQKTHTIHYGFIQENGEILDEVLVMLMRGPRSFTAEDTVEINCHGGVYAMQRILEAVLRSGARAAEPGEFTKRAFLNGRMDLSQAEAVMDVIQAQNLYALRSSVSQLSGSVQRMIQKLRERILYQTAQIEAALDDPEHISLEGYPQQLKKEAEDMLREMEHLIRTADNGRIWKEGIQTVILGRPNAGKSSLLNRLMGEERAIVTEIEGTTRDILEESISLNGITLNIVDTAGIRETENPVEKIGVARAREKAEHADLILCVVDSSVSRDENDREIFRVIEGKKAIILLNKSDLGGIRTEEELVKETKGKYPVIAISAREGTGIDRLTEELERMFYRGELSFNHEVVITNARHKMALMEASESLRRVLESIHMNLPEDFFSIDLMSAYEALGSIIGEEVGEDLVDEIFGKFCMGK